METVKHVKPGTKNQLRATAVLILFRNANHVKEMHKAALFVKTDIPKMKTGTVVMKVFPTV